MFTPDRLANPEDANSWVAWSLRAAVLGNFLSSYTVQ